MQIKYHHQFIKSYKKRIRCYSSLAQKFQSRLKIFMNDPTNPILKNHRLTGDLKGYWSFSVTGDVRIIYRVENDELLLYDIGTHNQVYR